MTLLTISPIEPKPMIFILGLGGLAAFLLGTVRRRPDAAAAKGAPP
jgi:hypothetical protein